MNKQSFNFGIEPSPIRKLFEYGKKRKMEIGEDNVFDFSLGNPSVEPPAKLKEKLLEIINSSSSLELHGYTSAAGDMKAREAIAKELSKRFDFEVLPELIFLTCGATASLTVSLNSVIEKDGDEVILFAPYFMEYKVFIEAAHGKAVVVNPDANFKPLIDDFEKKITDRTVAVIMNSPNNPSGVAYDDLTLKKLCSVLKKKEKEYGHPIYVISDEPYRELYYLDGSYPFIFRYYDNALINYSFSKNLSIPGERIGYVLVNKNCVDAGKLFITIAGAARKGGYVCAPSLMQHLIPHLVEEKVDLSTYKKNRDLIYQSLKDIGYEVIYPDGAFYLFVKALEEDDQAFSDKAKEYELLLVPSHGFGVKGYVRIAYCVDYEMIKRSIPAFKKLFDEYRRMK